MTEIYNNLLELKQISLDIAIADYKKLQVLDTNTTVNSREQNLLIFLHLKTAYIQEGLKI